MSKCVSKIKDKSTGECYEIKDCVAREELVIVNEVVDALEENTVKKDELGPAVRGEKLGLVTCANNSNTCGVYISPEGYISLTLPDDNVYNKRNSDYKTSSTAIPIKDLDKAIVEGLTTNSITLTDEQKQVIANWLGISSGKQYTHEVRMMGGTDGTDEIVLYYTSSSPNEILKVKDLLTDNVMRRNAIIIHNDQTIEVKSGIVTSIAVDEENDFNSIEFTSLIDGFSYNVSIWSVTIDVRNEV